MAKRRNLHLGINSHHVILYFAFVVFFFSIHGIAKAYEATNPRLVVSSASLIETPLPITGIAVAPLPDRRPRDQAITDLSAPSFWWPAIPGTSRWRLEIVSLQNQPNSTVQIETSTHWHNLKQALKPGQYQWRVTPLNPIQTQTGKWFRLTIGNRATSPDQLTTFTPRSIASSKSTIQNHLQQASTRMWLQRQKRNLENAVWLSSGFNGSANTSDGILAGILLSNELNSGLEAVKSLSLIAELETDPEQCATLVKKTAPLLAVAGTSAMQYQTNDQIARNIAWSLAMLVKRCPSTLDPSFKTTALQIIERYIADAYSDIVLSNRFAMNPLDSHGWTNLGFICGLAALTQSELSSSKTRLAESLPLYLNTFSPWGSEDGGFGNGSGYAYFAIAIQYEIWDALVQTQTINFYQHPWLKSIAQYMAAMQPSGVKNGTFGNSSELPSDHAVLATLIARLDTPFAASVRTSGVLPALPHYAILSGPPPINTARLAPAARSQLQWFESSGEVVLKGSDIQVYLRSSPYGSFNHSHPDQNSFIANINNKRMIGRSGVYDAYDSRHYKNWYKTTAAQSGITIRSIGNGSTASQKPNSLASIGQIAALGESGDFAWVMGSAHKAQAELKRADRLIIFRQPNEWLTVDIVDFLTQNQSYQVLYNLHVPATAAVLIEEQKLSVRDQQSQFCTHPLNTLITKKSDAVISAKWATIQDSAPPPIRYGERNQTKHLAYVVEPTQTSMIAMLFSASCSADDKPTIKTTSTGWEIRWDSVVWKLPKVVAQQ